MRTIIHNSSRYLIQRYYTFETLQCVVRHYTGDEVNHLNLKLKMESSLPLFEQFNVHTDPHTAGVRWDKWIKRLERLLEALDIIEKAAHSEQQKTAIDKRRLALLLHYAGPEVEDIYGTLTGNKDLYSTAKPLFATYFTPKKNVELDIFNFRRSQQEPAENMDAFVTRLRQQATRCNFAVADLEIILQII